MGGGWFSQQSHRRWALRRLTAKVVELVLVEIISHATVHQVLIYFSSNGLVLYTQASPAQLRYPSLFVFGFGQLCQERAFVG